MAQGKTQTRYTTDACVMMDARYIRDKSSGIGLYTEHLITELLKLDDTLRFRLITHPTRPRPFTNPRVTCQTFDAAPNSPLTRLVLAHLLDFEGVDLFHSPFNFLPAPVPVPSVFTLHDIMWLINPAYCMANPVYRAFMSAMYRYLIPRSVAEADRLMTVSHHSRQEIERAFPAKTGRVHVTTNGLDPFFHPVDADEAWSLIADKVPPQKRFVLVVGQGSPYKNHEGAVAAFTEAFKDDPSLHLVLVRRFSYSKDHELERLCADPRVAERIIRLSYVTGEELRALYTLADAFLFPSFYEGFGIPPLEAMACGTPVVASNAGAIAEVCGDGALQVDPHDTAAIAAALRRVVYEPEVAEAQVARGLENVRRFTWAASAEQALKVYRVVLGLEDAVTPAGAPTPHDATRVGA